MIMERNTDKVRTYSNIELEYSRLNIQSQILDWICNLNKVAQIIN